MNACVDSLGMIGRTPEGVGADQLANHLRFDRLWNPRPERWDSGTGSCLQGSCETLRVRWGLLM